MRAQMAPEVGVAWQDRAVQNVVVDVALDEAGQSAVVAKLSDDHWELNDMARQTDFLALQDIRDTD